MTDKIESSLEKDILDILDKAYSDAEEILYSGRPPEELRLTEIFRNALDEMSRNCKQASSAFTNIITALAIKAAMKTIDVRIHQVQIGAPFSFRKVSEDVIYPWLTGKDFEGAKSGWQTRTMERPKPYTMDFDENISFVKEPFLTCYDRMEAHNEDPFQALIFLFVRQIELRDQKRIELACPQINDIETITNFFIEHFSRNYRSKGGARLPVLAVYAIYLCLVKEVARFGGCSLKPLQEHSAADKQTESAGDIEVIKNKGHLFEAVEIKHNISTTTINLEDLFKKISPFRLERFYWLTTHTNCIPSDDQKKAIHSFQVRHGCQIIINGVVPSIKYYLRLLSEPSSVFPEYISLLKSDRAINHEHRAAWNNIISGSG